jgi:hypothetical protein
MVELEPARPVRAADNEEQKQDVPIVIRPDDFIVGEFSPIIPAEHQLAESFDDSDESVSEPDLLIDSYSEEVKSIEPSSL